MARPPKLRWEPARGKWKVEYGGKKYRFDGGRGKSDREAKKQAETEWKKIKAKIDQDAQLVRPYQEQYEKAIFEWERVLSWCTKNDDTETARLATDKLTSLRERMRATRLKPLTDDDLFENHIGLRAADLGDIPVPAVLTIKQLKMPLTGPLSPDRLARYAKEMDGTPTRIAREVWRDRIESQGRVGIPHKDSASAQLTRFVKRKEQEVEAGELSAARLNKLRLHLTHFVDWLGGNTAVTQIDGMTLEDYRANLLARVATNGVAGRWKRTTAGERMNDVRSFIRWLWRNDVIPTLPRNLDDKSLTISSSASTIVSFTIDEIQTLLTEASPRTRLFILLMLNCGMTQKDIADLLNSEVDWEIGRIVRKRSKTKDCENVPTVSYLLWPETFALLRAERTASHEHLALLNASGSPLWADGHTPEGKYWKNDNIRNAYERLQKKTGIGKPLKSLKKTSASLIRGNSEFTGLESLFLGHAPQSMADRHYAAIPQQLLDSAISWLREQYRLPELADVLKPRDRRQPERSEPKCV